MRLKRISTVVMAFIFTLMVPFSVSAGPGEWDYLGYDDFTYSSKTFYSGGGNFKFCITSGPTGWYYLYEDDATNADEWIGHWYLNAGSCVTVYDIGGYVDGDNKKAEFQIRKSFSGSARVAAWD